MGDVKRDPTLADSILGDLQEMRARRAVQSPVAARLWMWREWLAIGVFFAIRRAGDAVRHVMRTGFGLAGGSGDFRHALRSLRRTPWYAATAIGVVALGMALATTTFAIVDGVLFKPLPYARSGELYYVSGGYQKGQRAGIVVAPRNLHDWAAVAPGIGMTAFSASSAGPSLGDLRTWVPTVALIDDRFFDVLAVRPLIGGFQPEDFESAGSTAPAVVTYGLWQDVLGGRPDVLGQTLPSSGSAAYRVVGVMAPDFVFPVAGRFAPNVLTPLVVAADRRGDLRYRRVYGIARLPPALSLSDYQSRMDAAAVAEAVDWVPRPSDGTPVYDHAGLTPLETHLTGRQRPQLAVIFTTAAALVLLACLNISGLLASRTQDRARDFALRRALGAGRWHVARLLIVETGVIAAAGAALGLLLVQPLLTVTLRLLPDTLGLLKPIAVDWRVVGFAALATLVAMTLISVWPIWRSVRAPATPAMADGGQPTLRMQSTGRFLVTAGQVGLGLVLTLGGTLLIGSLVQVWRTNPGFRSDQLIVLTGRASGTTHDEHARAIDAFRASLGAVPGIVGTGATESPLLTGGSLMNAFRDGSTFAVTSGFFETAGLSLLDGRWLTTKEIESGEPVAVVSERAAKRIAPGERVVGREIKGYVDLAPRLFTVVGVVADARFGSWDNLSQGQIYAPYSLASDEQAAVTVLVRAGRRAADVIALLAPRLAAATENVRVTRMATADDMLDNTVRQRRLDSWLFGSFAVAALAIVGVGILGLMAMTTARRTREIGVRMALGSTRDRVVRLLLREQLAAVVAGLALGAAVSAWAVKFVKAYLYQVTMYDLGMWSVAILLMLLIAALGALVPAFRASHVDPVKALRVD